MTAFYWLMVFLAFFFVGVVVLILDSPQEPKAVAWVCSRCGRRNGHAFWCCDNDRGGPHAA